MRPRMHPIVGLVLVAQATSAGAQSSPPVLDLAPGEFSENLLEPGIKGRETMLDPMRMLVGLHRGRAAGPFRIEEVGALLPLPETPDNYCIRITSADARYASLNRYQKTTAKSPTTRVEVKSKYANELAKQYSSSDMIIRISSGSTCPGAKDAFIVAAVPPGVADTQELLTYLNVRGSHAQISLTKAEKVLAAGRCEHPEKPALVYSDVCVTPLSDLNGAIPEGLRVTYINDAGRVSHSDFRLIWGEK
jgi:hypothetical protein